MCFILNLNTVLSNLHINQIVFILVFIYSMCCKFLEEDQTKMLYKLFNFHSLLTSHIIQTKVLCSSQSKNNKICGIKLFFSFATNNLLKSSSCQTKF